MALSKEVEKARLITLSDEGVTDIKKYAPGSFGYHEAVHTVTIVKELLSAGLLHHPAILLNPALLEHGIAAHKALEALYNAMDKDHLEASSPS